MTVKISSVGLKGLEGYRVKVEVQANSGLESMTIVGLPDKSVKESKERVLSAIKNIGCKIADRKLIVNLSPSEQRKNGPLFDLAIAIGVLKEIGKIKKDIPSSTVFLGALSLDGTIETVDGLLPVLISAKQLGFTKAFIPIDHMLPLEMLEGLECIVVNHINEVLKYFNNSTMPPIYNTTLKRPINPLETLLKDFSHIIGHNSTKKALEIAAAGKHNVLMSGPPGCGKSLLAETFASILPPLTNSQQLEVISLYQLANEKLTSPEIPPYRNPHHSASSIAIIGGGSYPKPGEISLAHHGVLFLDEMAEFTKKTLDMLRQPLESEKITISRTHSTVTYPSSFILIGAMNPCPCGYLGAKSHYCTCSDKQLKAYRTRLSGPVYDRIDILLSLNPIDFNQKQDIGETSAKIRIRVKQAHYKQFNRYQQQIYNSNVPFEKLTTLSPLTKKQRRMISEVSSKNQWSNRVEIKIIRLARTISDLEGQKEISDESIIRAMELRSGN